jgi:hypothetical protein
MEAILFSETSENATATQRHIPEDDVLHSHRCGNLKSYKKKIISFLDVRGIIHFEFLSEKNTANQTVCMKVLKRLIDTVRRKRGDRSLIHQHDSARTFFASSVAIFSRKIHHCHKLSAVHS